jgi:succinate dehydrogenase / fumarate reductase flavoprotein subunit
MDRHYDVVIAGAGLAGLRAAIELGESARVAVISKVFAVRSHSGAAQGGIGAAIANEEPDQWEWHMFDTVKGSDYLADQDAVEIMTRDAPNTIYEMEHFGVSFNRTPDGRIAQRAFGGHTRDFGKFPVKRACYAADRTGRVILDTLWEQTLRMGVDFFDEHQVLSLILDEGTCTGVVAYELATGAVVVFRSKAVMLATGGAGKIYKTTSNALASTGDGMALAYRAGLPLEDMEFVQFHPTGIYKLGILISEAARGEGGVLRNADGERFMERYAPVLKDLAPRDLVSCCVLKEIQAGRGIGGQAFVHLDLTHLGPDVIGRKLAGIAGFAKTYAGVDVVREPIPVQPTCHYMMGGIAANADGGVMVGAGGTTLPGLFAAGECACVSVHGANRLGCNSLLDTLVFGRRTGAAMRDYIRTASAPKPSDRFREEAESGLSRLMAADGTEKIGALMDEMQQAMMEHVAVFRQASGLQAAISTIRELKERSGRIAIQDRGLCFNRNLMEAIELGHMLDLAEAIILCARDRRESRGAHWREDFPRRDDENFLHHTLVRLNGRAPEIFHRPVAITRFQPRERSY